MKNIIRAAAAAAIIAIIGLAGGSTALATDNQQVVVCKYVSTPGESELVQTGQNPIVVSVNALEDGFDGTFPFAFSDAQGGSIAIRYAVNSHDGDISECPGYVQPSPSPSSTPEPTPSVAPSWPPTTSPQPSVDPSLSPTLTPSEQPTPTTGPTSRPRSTMPPTDTASETTESSDLLSLLFYVGGFALGYIVMSLAISAGLRR